jgi:hypothetical protein
MDFHLGGLEIDLQADDPAVLHYWERLLENWHDLAPDARPDPAGGPGEQASVTLATSLRKSLPEPPSGRPVFTGRAWGLDETVGQLSVYDERDQFVFCFDIGARVEVPKVPGASGDVRIPAQITTGPLVAGRLADILFTSLAPVLRRRGYYLLHGFAAAHEGRAILLVGRSGSGKTTAGLALLAEGWQYLANDVVVLRRMQDKVIALPAPGGFTVTALSLRLLPWLPGRMTHLSGDELAKKYVPAGSIIQSWAPSAPVGGLYFPAVTPSEATSRRSVTKAVALARLIENSVDSWDHESIPAHVELLDLLTVQADSYDLRLGHNVAELADSLREPW